MADADDLPPPDHRRTASTGSGVEPSSAALDGAALGRAAFPRGDGAAGPRYDVRGLVGVGATSRVFAVHDRTFDREVALKVLHADRAVEARRVERFLREARITARLEHPGIAPVHDLDATADGGVYFTMRMIGGVSLGAALRALAAGRPAPAVTALYDRVDVLRRVCDALACAHARGIVHRDVKPDNIMLGGFGEVVLVDWGAALVVGEDEPAGRLVGTPDYMPPEQARGEVVDARADVYALGATLFHALVLRPPIAGRDGDDFWSAKRAGAIDPPRGAETARAERRLLAIALKAMEPDLSRRYPGVADLAADLAAWQVGQAVTAYRDPWLRRLGRWHRRHARGLWSGVAVAAALLVAVAAIWGERLKEIADWGRPVLIERFDDEGWRERWRPWSGGFERRDGRLVSQGERPSVLFLQRRLAGPVAIEFEGRYLPDAAWGDLSVLWSPLPPPVRDEPARDEPPGQVRIQVGAYDNSCAMIVGVDGGVIATVPYELAPDRPHRIRVEIDVHGIVLSVDGRRVLAVPQTMVIASSHIGLYAYYPDKAFDDIAIYAKGLPQRVSPLAIGHHALQEGRHADAARFFAELADDHAGHALADEARYHAGLSWRLAGDAAAAGAQWARVPPGRWGDRVATHGIEDLVARGDWDRFPTAFTDVYTRAGEDLRQRLRRLWAEALRVRPANPEQLLALYDALFPGAKDVANAHARMLLWMRRYDEVLARHPDEMRVATEALLRLGRSDEVLRRFSGRRLLMAHALLEAGRFDEVRAIVPPLRWAVEAVDNHRHDSSRERLRDRFAAGELAPAAVADRWLRGSTLAMLDRLAEDADAAGDRVHREMAALYRGETLSEPAADFEDEQRLAVSRVSAALRAWAAGDAAGREALRAEPTRADLHLLQPVGLALVLSRPAALALGVDRERGLAELAAIADGPRGWGQQRPWHCAAYVLGRIDDETFLRQPYSHGVGDVLVLMRALRADLAGDAATAVAAYRAWLALPPLRRRLWFTCRDPVAETLAAWRSSVLAR